MVLNTRIMHTTKPSFIYPCVSTKKYPTSLRLEYINTTAAKVFPNQYRNIFCDDW